MSIASDIVAREPPMPRRAPKHALFALRDEMFRRPWWWLGVEPERWHKSSFETRVSLF